MAAKALVTHQRDLHVPRAVRQPTTSGPDDKSEAGGRGPREIGSFPSAPGDGRRCGGREDHSRHRRGVLGAGRLLVPHCRRQLCVLVRRGGVSSSSAGDRCLVSWFGPCPGRQLSWIPLAWAASAAWHRSMSPATTPLTAGIAPCPVRRAPRSTRTEFSSVSADMSLTRFLEYSAVVRTPRRSRPTKRCKSAESE